MEKFKVESIIEKARELFEKDGYITPVCFVVEKDKPATIIPGMFTNDIDKDMFSYVIRNICKTRNVIEIAIISEVWMKKFNKNEMDEIDCDMRVSEYEDKEEVIMIQHETKLSSVMYIIPIIRNGEKTSLGETKKIELTSVEGRFCNILYSDDIEKTKH